MAYVLILKNHIIRNTDYKIGNPVLYPFRSSTTLQATTSHRRLLLTSLLYQHVSTLFLQYKTVCWLVRYLFQNTSD